jgi:hypothetical protein
MPAPHTSPMKVVKVSDLMLVDLMATSRDYVLARRPRDVKDAGPRKGRGFWVTVLVLTVMEPALQMSPPFRGHDSRRH